MVKDPVCGKQVNEETTEFNSEHLGNRYYFCTEKCKNTFDSSPFMYSVPGVRGVRRRGCCG
ncbi:MAG: YHS domain-containing protein [Candidatus Thorarchaeota archaeon]